MKKNLICMIAIFAVIFSVFPVKAESAKTMYLVRCVNDGCTKYKYAYNENGLIRKQTDSYDDVYYTYSGSHIIKEVDINPNGTIYTITNTYKNGKFIKSVTEYNRDGYSEWWHIKCENGNIVRYANDTIILKYKYDKSGRMIKTTWIDKSWGIKDFFTYKYDAKGNPIKVIHPWGYRIQKNTYKNGLLIKCKLIEKKAKGKTKSTNVLKYTYTKVKVPASKVKAVKRQQIILKQNGYSDFIY